MAAAQAKLPQIRTSEKITVARTLRVAAAAVFRRRTGKEPEGPGRCSDLAP